MGRARVYTHVAERWEVGLKAGQQHHFYLFI